ncbi:hypothetical protein [Ktedonospora formicarum]|uniref:Uncharacterized protein n=1 Tax=Ktedonospora formicarum TaxID=2778364 RepID=A0A8J3MWP9_9CHLR|nr:hypothetical protein [Ktedonospora formicarum]GHO50575.1 hypothetical protein KSX_87380 [Ktedonospora formicarum]
MERLSTLLKQHQIEGGSLEILFPTAQEKSYVLTCEGTAAFSCWQRLRSLVTRTEYWPVILGGVDIYLD